VFENKQLDHASSVSVENKMVARGKAGKRRSPEAFRPEIRIMKEGKKSAILSICFSIA
jgi:hypothetical protein